MADNFTPTVVQQTIPNIDMTPLERLLLIHIFGGEPDGEGLYFYAEDGPADMIWLDRKQLDVALAASKSTQSQANAYVTDQRSRLSDDDNEIELDVSGTSWEFLMQDIVRRSATLRYVTVVASFTCSKMRPDGFGGMAVLITADRILGKSTSDLIEDFLSEAGLDE